MGPACDVYSLGVILYELLAGRLPFEGDALLMVSRVLLEGPPPSQFRPGLDPELEAAWLRAMAKRLERAFLGPDRHVNGVSFAPDGGAVLATDHPGQALYLWDAASGELPHTFRGKHNLNRAVFSPDGRRVACGGFRGHVYQWACPAGMRCAVVWRAPLGSRGLAG